MKRIKIDRLGRVVIPVTFRRVLGFHKESAPEAYLDEDRVVICRSSNCCKLCYAKIDGEYGVGLCQACIEKIKGL